VKNLKEISKKEIFRICKTCITGSCCQDGVDVDLREAKKISKLKLNLKKPWFEGLSQDRDMPSGWAVSTAVRNSRCVFQKNNYECLIYKDRPKHCRDFPLENGQIAELYHYLCEKPTGLKSKVKRDFRNYYLKFNKKELRKIK